MERKTSKEWDEFAQKYNYFVGYDERNMPWDEIEEMLAKLNKTPSKEESEKPKLDYSNDIDEAFPWEEVDNDAEYKNMTLEEHINRYKCPLKKIIKMTLFPRRS